ncbi:MAG: hypothetical protein AAGF88_12135 [Pseudomonadota bacterium]
MRILLFFLVNVAVAIAVGTLSYFQGQNGLTIALRIAGSLIAIQVLYVAWLLVVAYFKPLKARPSTQSNPQTMTPKGTNSGDPST